MNDTVSAGQQPLAQARAEELERLHGQHAAQGSAASAFALAKALWRNGRYETAVELFTQARDLAPMAPDAHVALVRAALMLADRGRAATVLAQALAAYPQLPELAVHQAQLLAADDPAAARAAVAPHRNDDVLCGLFHEALDGLIEGRAPAERQAGDRQLEAIWAGHRWLATRQPPPALVGTPPELLVRALAAATVPGLVLEFGVYFGRSLAQLAAAAGQVCHGFDSFQGLPSAWTADEGAGAYTTAGLQPQLGPQVQLHAGWFQDTLPVFLAQHPGAVRLMHIDCDLYESTRTALDGCADRLVAGSVIVFDDMLGYPGSEQHEFRAWHDFARERGLAWSVLAGTLLGREVAVRIDGTGA
jgi:predicted O-methyltransferase YrrM